MNNLLWQIYSAGMPSISKTYQRSWLISNTCLQSGLSSTYQFILTSLTSFNDFAIFFYELTNR